MLKIGNIQFSAENQNTLSSLCSNQISNAWITKIIITVRGRVSVSHNYNFILQLNSYEIERNPTPSQIQTC